MAATTVGEMSIALARGKLSTYAMNEWRTSLLRAASEIEQALIEQSFAQDTSGIERGRRDFTAAALHEEE